MKEGDLGQAGADAVCLRTMTEADLPRGVELCRLAGWNQRIDDWRMFLAANPGGCFVAVHDGRVVGTVTTIDYAGAASWVGMVLVDPSIRRMGIGKRLLTAAIDSLSRCACVKLDATPAGKKLYDTLGFVDEYGLSRMTVAAVPQVAAPPASVVRLMAAADLQAVVALDAEAFGASRNIVVESLFRMAPEFAHVAVGDGGRVCGSSLGRHGENFEHLGPICAADLPTAQALAQACLAGLAGRAVLMDVMLHNPQWRAWLESLGFIEQRQFIRMYRGRNLPGRPERQYCISGPELG